MENQDPSPKGLFDNVSPKLSFLFGAISALALFSTIGFIIMLGQQVDGLSTNGSVKGAQAAGAEGPAAKPTTPTANPTPSAPAKTVINETVAASQLRNIRGQGKLTVVEFSDPECPFCKRFHSVMQQVVKDYDGKVRWAYGQFPLESLHQKAPREAQATECAADQKKFWEYLDLLMERTPSNDGLEDAELFKIADDLKLNRATFDSCLENQTTKSRVDQDSDLGQKLGGQGTPYSVIIDENGKVLDTINGALAYSQVASTLDALLK